MPFARRSLVFVGLLAMAPAVAQSATVEASAGRVTLHWTIDRVEGCQVAGREELARWHAARLDEALTRVGTMLGVDAGAAAANVALWVVDDEADARVHALAVCHREFQELGVLAAEARAAVVCPGREHRARGPLLRMLTHAATWLFVAQRLPPSRQDELGYGWLAAGVAHHATSALPDGAADGFVVRDVLRSARCWSGDFVGAGAVLVKQEQFPSLAALFATRATDFDFAQHVASFALVAWLHDDPGAGDGERVVASPQPALARIVAAAVGGTSASAALAAELGGDATAFDARLREFATRAAPLVGATKVEAVPHCPHPHAAIYLCASEPVAARHRAVVDAALRRRHAAHTSGWQDDDGKPRLRLGAVNRRAGFWHGDELVKPIDRTWPFVVVLEYEPAGDPRAFLDCFRRPADQRGDDGWSIDPGVDFAAHHNAQIATASDDRFAYLAVPDTPTGGHVGGSEFVHRARVAWADGRSAVLGIRSELIAPKGKPATAWHTTQTPLVDWRVLSRSPLAGALAVGALREPERELAIWGTDRILVLPPIPPGLLGGRGRN